MLGKSQGSPKGFVCLKLLCEWTSLFSVPWPLLSRIGYSSATATRSKERFPTTKVTTLLQQNSFGRLRWRPGRPSPRDIVTHGHRCAPRTRRSCFRWRNLPRWNRQRHQHRELWKPWVTLCSVEQQTIFFELFSHCLVFTEYHFV